MDHSSVVRSPIHANEDYDLYSIEYSVRCAVEHVIVFTWLICINGTSCRPSLLKNVTRYSKRALCRILGTKCVTCLYIDKFAPFHNQMSVFHNIFVKFL